jgi:hypothetical protein
MINKQFDLIGKSDIDALVTNGVREGKTLDYKQVLPTSSSDDRKEFLSDIASFANAMGGDILFGVPEKRTPDGKKTGLPEAITGLNLSSSDEEIRRLDQMVQTGLDPKLGVQIRAIDGFPAGPLILVRIPKSWASPHMVATGGSRFYSRNNAGKYPLDVREIRSAFAVSESLPEKVRRFRDDRLSRIVAADTPVPLEEGAKTILHVLPVSALEPAASVDVERQKEANLEPLYSSGWNSRFNLDGVLTYSPVEKGRCHSYAQFFRTGAIETVETLLLRVRDGMRFIPSTAFEQHTIKTVGSYLTALKKLEVGLPAFVMLSLMGVSGFWMGVSERYVFFDRVTIDRDVLILPDIIIEEYGADPSTALRPALDALWQAAGFPRSLSYDQDGTWAPK